MSNHVISRALYFLSIKDAYLYFSGLTAETVNGMANRREIYVGRPKLYSGQSLQLDRLTGTYRLIELGEIK